MKQQLRTEAEKREIGWYFVIFSGNERPAYFNGKNWIVWGNMGFWDDSDLSKISDRLIPDFHAQQSKERDWISVDERLPNAFDSDENGKVLIFRNNNDSQSTMPKSIHPFEMVKHCDKDTFWMPLPKNPSRLTT